MNNLKNIGVDSIALLTQKSPFKVLINDYMIFTFESDFTVKDLNQKMLNRDYVIK